MEMDPHAPLPVVHRERLDVVQHSGRRLLGLIDQLLQIGKIEQGKKALKPKSVNVQALAKNCVDALQVAARDRSIGIEIDIEQPETSSVRADPEALEQVLTNLLSNAIKYNREQGRVRIRFRAADEGEITVDDTGKGLTDSQLGQLFEPFNRLGADKSQVQGTGLGLVITRQLVDAMGGKLDVWSQVGKGTRFTVRLPLGRRTRHPVSETTPLDLPSQWDTGTQYTVLYVEDDEVNLVLMEQMFATQPDWKLLTASTGVEGITTAVRQRPQIVLLDMNLPDMSGADVFKRLRADRRTRDIPCVAVSADALPDQIDRAEALGFEDYWTKPLNLPVTVSRLKKLLQ
jgi:CheY-like chemotaxis protein